MSGVLLAGWRFRAVVWSVLLATAGYLAFSLWGGWQGVVAAFARVGVAGLLLVLSMSLLNYGLRFARWQCYLQRLGWAVSWRDSLRIYMAGFAMTTTPGKVGEALRSVLLRRWQVPYATSFALLLSERLSDLVAIVLLALIGVAQYPPAQPLVWVGLAGIGALFLVLGSEPLLQRLGRGSAHSPNRWLRRLYHPVRVALEARRCHAPMIFFAATLMSTLAWLAEAVAFYWVLQWMGADIPLAFAIFVYAVSMLAGALSFLPGGLGGAEVVMTALLMSRGMAAADAVAATVLIRLATLWFAVALGMAALFLSRGEMAGGEAVKA